jgi:hypothetical protein
MKSKQQEKIDLLRGFIDDYEQGIIPQSEFTQVMTKELIELERLK